MGQGTLVTKQAEKSKEVSDTFASALTGKVYYQAFKAPKPRGRLCQGEALPAVEDTVKVYFGWMDMSMKLGGTYLVVLKVWP